MKVNFGGGVCRYFIPWILYSCHELFTIPLQFISQVFIADALRATQIQLSYQQIFYYYWNHCSVCSISMLEYAGSTNSKHTVYHIFITKVFIQGLTLSDFSFLYPFLFLTYFPKSTLTRSKSKIQVVFGVFLPHFYMHKISEV